MGHEVAMASPKDVLRATLCRASAQNRRSIRARSLYPSGFREPLSMLREAGGVLMTMDGEPADLNVKTSIMAGAPAAIQEFLQLK